MNLYNAADYHHRIVGEVLATQARAIGDNVWLWSDERKVTFRQAHELTNRYANALLGMGLAKGQTVAVSLNPSLDMVLLAIAAMKAGGVFAPISTEYKGAFLADGLANSKAPVLAIAADDTDRFASLGDLGEIRHLVTVGGQPAVELSGVTQQSLEALAQAPAGLPEVEIYAGDASMVWWSSGTTGKAKGVLHTHSSILYPAYRQGRRGDHQPGDVLYSCTPMFLGSPWNFAIWTSLVSGVTAAIDARFSVSKYWDRIRYYGATGSILLGAMHQHLWKLEPSERDRDNTLRYAFFVPLDYDMIPRFKERYGIEVMHQAFGTSEGGTILEALDNGSPWSGRAVGVATEHLEVALLDEHDQEVPVGEVGELCIRPRIPDVMFREYFNDPENTVSYSRNYWYHVGDTMVKDEAGIFYFAGRKKDYVRYKGRNISLSEIERVAEQHPAVFDVAAFGVPCEEIESEEEVALAVVVAPGQSLTEKELASFINDNGPYYFVPRFIGYEKTLPRNGHGRLMKKELTDKFDATFAWDLSRSDYEVRR